MQSHKHEGKATPCAPRLCYICGGRGARGVTLLSQGQPWEWAFREDYKEACPALALAASPEGSAELLLQRCRTLYFIFFSDVQDFNETLAVETHALKRRCLTSAKKGGVPGPRGNKSCVQETTRDHIAVMCWQLGLQTQM